MSDFSEDAHASAGVQPGDFGDEILEDKPFDEEDIPAWTEDTEVFEFDGQSG